MTKLPIASRYIQATHDTIGPRPYDTLGFVVHMAEGLNVATYLAGNNVGRNVSVHFTIEQKTSTFADGEIIQQMDLDRISGSINPGTVRTTDDPDGYYGASHAKHVVGSYWPRNVNRAVITVELAGRGVIGPNPAQVESLLRLFAFLRERYPDIKPLGHRDWQSVKGCPGYTRAIKDAFARMGGHGKDFTAGPAPVPTPPTPQEDTVQLNAFNALRIGDVAKGTPFKTSLEAAFPDSDVWKVQADATVPVLGFKQSHALIPLTFAGGDVHLCWIDRKAATNLRERPPVTVEVPGPAPDCPDPQEAIQAAVAPALAKLDEARLALTSAGGE